jgi:metallophosphoesterase superfamily enzyme
MNLKIVSKHITVSEEVLTITNQRCLYWPKKNCLILSDLHVGKTAHFRRSGIPIPSEVLQTDLRRLSLLIEHFKPTDILIVGDLFHAGSNNDLILFKQWFQKYQHLVMGIS